MSTLMTPEAASAMQTYGPVISIFGAINGAIGSYYQAKNQQYQLKSQALTQQFQADLAKINAGVAEDSAQQTMLAGERQIGQLTMRAGKLRSARRASTAARGIALDEGSTAEIAATEEWAKQYDALTISANTTRAAESQRMQKVNYQNSALLSSVSAANLNASADTISPIGALGSSLMSGATSVASSWFRDTQLAELAKALRK